MEGSLSVVMPYALWKEPCPIEWSMRSEGRYVLLIRKNRLLMCENKLL